MAGTYADVPGVRIPYHIDGSLVRWALTVSTSDKTVSGAWTEHSQAEKNELNDGDTASAIAHSMNGGQGKLLAIVFPQPVTLTGHNLIAVNAYYSYFTAGLEYSTNTTDGGDGTWASTPSDVSAGGVRLITAVNLSNVKGLRMHGYASGGTDPITYRDVAFYGNWTPVTLTGWHPTLDQQIPAAHLDFGDMPLNMTSIKQFRIKNGRGLQANNVVVSAVDGTDQTRNGLQVSLDGSTWTSTVTITSIAAGAISQIVHIRRAVGSGEVVGTTGIVPVKFVATTWT